MDLKEKTIKATKDILEKNLRLNDDLLKDKKIIFIYDEDSELSKLVSYGYITNLANYKNAEIILFDENKGAELKEKILDLEEFSTVIMVQSTNFRLEEFRIRMSLQHRNIGGIEHNHLYYIKDYEIENYINAISYNSDYYEQISEKLKNQIEKSNEMKIISSNGSYLKIEGGFEEMKQNTGNYEINNRYGTLPMGENFTESKIFSNMNGEIYIKAFPGEDFQVIICEPFKIKIEKSLIIDYSPNTPKEFIAILDKIRNSEGEVMIRELGFGLNKAISFEKTLSDINAFERMSGFHMSLGKKHNIYRKKLHHKIIQRYHIDIFPDAQEIILDGISIFKNHEYIL